MTKVIPWTTGSGNITLTYSGLGNDTIVVESSDNDLPEARSQVITVSTTVGNISRQITISQGASQSQRTKYLTFTARESGTFTLTIPADITANEVALVQYSIDNGQTWNLWVREEYAGALTITTPTIQKGQSVLWRGIAKQYAKNQYTASSRFSSTELFDVSGNIMSMINGFNFLSLNNFDSNSTYTFYRLFYMSNVVNAEDLCLPATTLTNYCYFEMFRDCSFIMKAPKELPAVILTTGCYQRMFYDSSYLTTAPVLPAENLVENCYNLMFSNCARIKYIKAMFILYLSSSIGGWLNNVASSGTFVKNVNATWSNTGIVPSGWTVETASS